jgi:glycosyltransferase involved in cell wall biosynthesis
VSAAPRLVYATTPAAAGTPRLLLASWHFPPGDATGALRWQRLAPFIAERGWSLDVLTADPSELPRRDDSRLAELPAGVRIFGVTQPRLLRDRVEKKALALKRRLRTPVAGAELPAPSRAAGRAPATPDSFARTEVGWIPRRPRDLLRAWFAAGDYARYGAWATAVVEAGIAIARDQPPSIVISCGPPHMAHDAGRRIAERLGCPYVMDLRDQWRLWERLPEALAHPLWWGLAARYESKAVARASLVVTNTDRARLTMQQQYPAQADRIITVLNGYDDEPLPPATSDGVFRIAYAGNIYLDRDPRPLFRAVAGLIARTPADARVEVAFMGEVRSFDGRTLESIAADEGIASHIRLYPPRVRHEALRFLATAPVLISLPQDSVMAIPSKLFEYIRFPAWVVTLAEPASASALFSSDIGADLVWPGDVDALTALLVHHFHEFQSHGRPEPLARDTRFSRREQARRLLDRLAPLLAGRRVAA